MHFNERFDYPVLIFHDGLSPKTRESIVAKTPGQRIWPGAQSMLQPSLHTRTKLIFRFFSVGNWVPSEAQHALHSNFGAGARAQGGPQRFLGLREFGSEGSAAGSRRHVGVDQKYQSAQQRAEPSPGYMAQSRFRSGLAVGEVGFRLVLPRLLVLAATA